jgi:peptidylprolyl isomerase
VSHRVRRAPALVVLLVSGTALLAACGSSPGATVAPSTTAAASQAPAAGPSVAAPALVPAAAVPAVTGPLGYEPKVAATTAPAPSQLLVHDVVVGDGSTAEPGDILQVQYTGVLYPTAKKFDASWTDGNGNYSFTLDASPAQVIAGWDQGLVGMKVGGRRELVIPPSLAYMDLARTGIPADSTLVFVIDLRSAVPPE